MTRVTSLVKLRVPLGGQEIELQHLDYDSGDVAASAQGIDAMSQAGPGHTSVPINLLRTRIREKSRFTVFDIDAGTAQAWGEALLQWARSQGR